MSVLDGIERLQKASLAKRKVVLVVSVVVLMSAIASIWVWQATSQPATSGNIPSVGPIKVIWGSFKENIKNIYEKR